MCVRCCFCGSRFFFRCSSASKCDADGKNGEMSGRHSSPCREHDENEQLLYGVTLDICLNSNNSQQHPPRQCTIRPASAQLQLHSWSEPNTKKKIIIAAWLRMCVGWLIIIIIISVVVYRGQESWSDKERNSTAPSNVGRAALPFH